MTRDSILLNTAILMGPFGRLIIDGRWTDTWEYFREISPSTTVTPYSLALIAPSTDPDSLDLRCGQNASTLRSAIKTATVRAGDTGDTYPSMYHPGFASAWLSKTPSGNLDTYTGDGDWFKILSVTDRAEQSLNFSDPYFAPYYDQFKSLWGSYRPDSYNFTVPATTPPGKYLLRFKSVFLLSGYRGFAVLC
ncbi:hypothetical protein B0O99DRAFT_748143 [Bisporella sp. PMI_857]|nr:hypothetical protein B0O99DRAFT_748143 [Bisporella sp. PMI_857]